MNVAAVSREVRNFGTPSDELSCVSQQCLYGFLVQVRSGNRPVFSTFYEVYCHQPEAGIGIGKYPDEGGPLAAILISLEVDCSDQHIRQHQEILILLCI